MSFRNPSTYIFFDFKCHTNGWAGHTNTYKCHANKGKKLPKFETGWANTRVFTDTKLAIRIAESDVISGASVRVYREVFIRLAYTKTEISI